MRDDLAARRIRRRFWPMQSPVNPSWPSSFGLSHQVVKARRGEARERAAFGGICRSSSRNEVARMSSRRGKQLGRRITVGIESCVPSVRLDDQLHHLNDRAAEPRH